MARLAKLSLPKTPPVRREFERIRAVDRHSHFLNENTRKIESAESSWLAAEDADSQRHHAGQTFDPEHADLRLVRQSLLCFKFQATIGV